MSLTKRLLRSKVWFASMDTAVEAAVNDCLACQANTDTTQHELGIISQLPKDKTALVSLDFSSKTPTGEYLLIAKYERGRYPAIAMTRGLTARDAIRAATLIFERHGFPEHVKSDNGPAFIAGEFKQFLHRFKIKHIKITPLHPEANGGAEKIMNSINKCIRCAEVEGTNWKRSVDKWVENYRETPNTATGLTPNEVMNKNNQYKSLPSLAPDKTEAEINKKLEINDANAREKAKAYNDKRNHAKHVTFKEGDPVLVKWKRNDKYQPLFDPDAYEVKSVKGNMVEAERPDHYICRNCKYFKKITSKCYEESKARRSRSHSPETNKSWTQTKLRPREHHDETEQHPEQPPEPVHRGRGRPLGATAHPVDNTPRRELSQRHVGPPQYYGINNN